MCTGNNTGQGVQDMTSSEENNHDQTQAVLQETDLVQLTIVLQHRPKLLTEKELVVYAFAIKTWLGQD